MRCPSFQFPIKTALPVRSFSSKEYAVHPIIFLELVRCRRNIFFYTTRCSSLSSQACAAREMIFFESIAARRFISLKMICFQLVFPPLKCMPFPSEQFPQKNALPVGSFSSNECATSRIMLFKRMRCPSDQFPAKNSLPVGSFSSKEYAARPINLLNRMRCRYVSLRCRLIHIFVVAVSHDSTDTHVK